MKPQTCSFLWLSVATSTCQSILIYCLSCPFAIAADCQKTILLDLTYPFDNETIYWPTEKGFKLHKIAYGETPKGYFYSAYKFCAPEHGGTHIDAPRHFSKDGRTVDKIPVDAMRGKLVVVNVVSQANVDHDYAITMADIKRFEKQYRNINSQDIVLFYTGWGRYWGNKIKYLGNDTFGDTNNLHFPGLSKDAAHYLVNKKVKAIGLDTPSLDPGISVEFWAHRILSLIHI